MHLFITRSLATLTMVVLAAGCAAEATDDDVESAAGEIHTQTSAGYIADVSAAGSGCPAGSWRPAISPDGQTFTLTFSAYEVKVSPGQTFDMKSCVVNIDLRDPTGAPISFLVGSIAHQGYAFLDTPGMKAQRNATYVFGGSGNSARPVTSHSVLGGPYESSYLQTDDVLAGRWTACSGVSNLVVNTNLMLQNNVQRTGSGYLNHAVVDGSLTVAFRLSWRHC